MKIPSMNPVKRETPVINPQIENSEPLLWGIPVIELHDRYWLAREVAIVRLGFGDKFRPDQAAARVYLLAGPTDVFRLHLRPVLERHYWIHQSLYMLGFKGCAERSTPFRLGMTVRPDIARFWAQLMPRQKPWMALRAAFPDNTGMRIPGRFYGRNQQSEYISLLARDWPDPEQAIDGITKLGRKVRGPANADPRLLKSAVRPLWIGRGHERWTDGALPQTAALFDRG